MQCLELIIRFDSGANDVLHDRGRNEDSYIVFCKEKDGQIRSGTVILKQFAFFLSLLDEFCVDEETLDILLNASMDVCVRHALSGKVSMLDLKSAEELKDCYNRYVDDSFHLDFFG
jgi:hypothetical protein